MRAMDVGFREIIEREHEESGIEREDERCGEGDGQQ